VLAGGLTLLMAMQKLGVRSPLAYLTPRAPLERALVLVHPRRGRDVRGAETAPDLLARPPTASTDTRIESVRGYVVLPPSNRDCVAVVAFLTESPSAFWAT
jgi:hypothetical protein